MIKYSKIYYTKFYILHRSANGTTMEKAFLPLGFYDIIKYNL